MKSRVAAAAALVTVVVWSPGSAKAGLLDEIVKRGEILLATEAAYHPFEFVEGGKIVGYGQDLTALIMKDLTAQGVKVKQLDLPFQGLLPGLLAKKFDMANSAMTMTAERAQKVAFTVPFATSTPTVVARKDDNSIKKIEDLVGKVVGAQQGGAGVGQLKRLDERLRNEKGAGLKEVKEYIGFPELYGDLLNGRIDAVQNALPLLAVLIKQHPDKYKLVGTHGDSTYFGWVLRKEDSDLLKYVNDRLIRLKEDGTVRELQMKWFGMVMDTPNVDIKLPGTK